MNTFLSVIPPVLVIVLSLTTKNIVISLIAGIVLGSLIVNGPNFLEPILDTYFVNGLTSNGSVLIAMIVLGIMLRFVKQAGGYKAFAQWTQRSLNSEKQIKSTVFWASLIFSINPYLVNLCVPRVMKTAVHKTNMPAEKIPMIVISVANAASSLLPFTMFILFFSGLIVSTVEGYDGYTLYVQAIPFQFFAILSVVTAFLYAYGIIPDIGPIKKLSGHNQDFHVSEDSNDIGESFLGGEDVVPDMKALVIPVLTTLICIPVFSFIKGSIVLTAGLLVGCFVAVAYALITKRVKFSETMGMFVGGFTDMGAIFFILICAFAFGQVVTALQFPAYIIGLLGSNFSASTIPVVAFLVCCLISYATGSLSASAIIVFPLSMPLALATGASIPLTIGACISGSHFGDLYSPISDNVIMPSEACDMNPVDISKLLTPYRLIQLVICAVLYLVAGMIM